MDLLLSEIPAIVEREWQERQRPLLLSQLGGRLSDAAKLLVRSENVGLKRLIEEYLGSTLRLLPMPSHGGGVAPRLATEDLNDAEIENKYISSVQIPNYELAVFNAFRRHIPLGSRRFILLENGALPRTKDQDEGSDPPPFSHEIVKDDLPADDAGGRVATRVSTHEAIMRWCEKHGIAAERLHHVPRIRFVDEPDRPSARNARSASRPSSDIDGIIFGLSVFTPSELARIQIPGDVLQAVLERLRTP